MPVPAAIAIGSNLGDREAHLAAALVALRSLPQSELLAFSRSYETAPVGPVPQGPYLNAAAMLSTSLPPRDLLAHLQAIERSRGRERAASERWGPRTLDLDLLIVGDQAIDEPGLTIPHPHLRERAFVLVPLASIAPDLAIPASPAGPRITVADALTALRRAGAITPEVCTLYQQP